MEECSSIVPPLLFSTFTVIRYRMKAILSLKKYFYLLCSLTISIKLYIYISLVLSLYITVSLSPPRCLYHIFFAYFSLHFPQPFLELFPKQSALRYCNGFNFVHSFLIRMVYETYFMLPLKQPQLFFT